MSSLEFCFFFSSRRRHTRWTGDWSSDVCSSDLIDSEILVSPSANRPACSRQDFSCALGTGMLYSMALSLPPVMLSGGLPPSFEDIFEIGRASCRKECRSRWWPYDEKTKL